MYIRQTKNESKVSSFISQAMRFGQYFVTTLSQENVVAMRQLSRYRLAMVNFWDNCKRIVITLLD